MRVRSLLVTLSLIAALPVTAVASAGSKSPPNPELVPRSLVERLLASRPGPDGEPPELRVGELPEDLASKVTFPEEVEVVGSLSWKHRSALLVAVPGAPAAAERLLSDFWVAKGWEVKEEEKPVEQGFVEAEDQERFTILCRPGGDSLLWSLEPRGKATTEALVRYDNLGYSHCRRMFDPMTTASQVPFPRLKAPPGSKSSSGGRSSGGGEEQRDQRLETELSAAEVLEHYSVQLSDQGWIPDAPVIYGPLAYQSWRMIDDAGLHWHGLLLVTEKEGSARNRSVIYRVSRLARE